MATELQVLDLPVMHPGKCGRCSSTKQDGRKYIDTGADFDYYTPSGEAIGVMYLCTHCVREIFKFAFPTEGPPVAESEAKIADLEQTIVLQQELLRLKSEQIAKLEEAYGVLEPSGNSIMSADSSPVVSAETSGESSIEDGDRSPKKRAARTTKSTASTGSKDVPSLTELLKSKSST